MCLDFDPASLQTFQRVEKRTVDRGITSKLSQALWLERGHTGIEQLARGGIRSHDTHVFIDDQQTLAHTGHGRV